MSDEKFSDDTDKPVGTDDLVSQMEAHELEDKADAFGLLTPREYGRLRNMAPQLIYYHLRAKHIEGVDCDRCGRANLINVEQADKALQARKKAQGVDLSPDQDRHTEE
jgi:hypothetical protein